MCVLIPHATPANPHINGIKLLFSGNVFVGRFEY